MTKTARQNTVRTILLGLAVGMVMLVLHGAGLFRSLEWKSWDWRLRALADSGSAGEEIIILLVDQHSLDFYEQEGLGWPWPRQLYAAAVQFCQTGGARAVVFDVLFTESSVYGLEDDLYFGMVLAEAGNAALAAFFSAQEPAAVDTAGEAILRQHALSLPGWPAKKVLERRSVSLSIEEILSSARSVGNVSFPPDDDCIFRRLPLICSYRGRLYPVLPLAVVRQLIEDWPPGQPGESSSSGIEKSAASDPPGIGGLSLSDGALYAAGQRLPLDESGRLIINYHGGVGTYRSISMADVIQSQLQLEEGLEPQIDPAFFQDKIVLVGFSAPGLMDLRPTPFSSVYPGVEIHATVIDNLLAGDLIDPAPGWMTVVMILLAALLTALAVTGPQKLGWMAAGVAACLLLPVAAAALAYHAGLWLVMVTPLAAAVVTFAAGSVLNYTLEGQQKRFVKKVFQHYLSHQVIDQILKDPDRLKLGGQRRQMSVFFSDVAGFTSVAESLSPEDLTELLNRYLSEMTAVIFRHGGTVDKYIGDAIVAFWNAPLDQPDHAVRACQAALDCQKRLVELRDRMRRQSGRELHMRIGINTGPMVVGNMGSSDRFDYSILGDAVNLGARLEGACKQYGIWILMGEGTYAEVRDQVEAREIDRIRVVGKREPVRIYELLARRGQLSQERRTALDRFHEGLRLYRERKWTTAIGIFKELPDDPVARIYVERCEQYQVSPPPEDWDGVWELTRKH
jgi:adenylate cyclase